MRQNVPEARMSEQRFVFGDFCDSCDFILKSSPDSGHMFLIPVQEAVKKVQPFSRQEERTIIVWCGIVRFGACSSGQNILTYNF